MKRPSLGRRPVAYPAHQGAWQSGRIEGAQPIVHQESKPMIGYIIVSIISGVLFGVLDGVINANPLAQRLYEVYKPIAKTSINPLAGIMIDLVYGFVMGGVFLLLFNSLPGETGVVKGVC